MGPCVPSLDAVQRHLPRALRAHAAPLALVDLLVLEQVLLLGEALRALAALVRPLPGVDPLVPDQVGGVAEGLPAVRAAQDPSAAARVRTPVDDEGFLLVEPLLALLTLVRPPPGVAPLARFVAAVGVDASHAPRIDVHPVRGGDAGEGFCTLALPEPLRGHAGPLLRVGPRTLLTEEPPVVSSALAAALCAVALLVSRQHLPQTAALPTRGTRVSSPAGTVLSVERGSVVLTETLFSRSRWHQPAHALVSRLHGRAVGTGTLENQLLRLPAQSRGGL